MGIRTRVIGFILAVLILVSGAGYLYYRTNLDNAVSNTEILFDKIELKGFRLLPSPMANITLIYVANNTENVEFRLSLKGELYYGSHFITPLTVNDALIRANGLSTFKMDVTISGAILTVINPEIKEEYLIQGDLVASTKIFGLIPISITKSLSDYQPGQR
jgi:hypothetical protein